jgi:hypothetical protein
MIQKAKEAVVRRFTYSILAVGIMVLFPLTLAAQGVPPPVTTEEAQPVQTAVPPPVVPVATAAAPVPSAPLAIVPLPTAVEATAAPVSPIDKDSLALLVNERTDLELLANQAMNGQRPTGWSGSLDINNVQLPILVRLDLELLAGALLGQDKRPDGWFGPVPSSTYAIARDIRHDLELLADYVNPANVRPPGWAGGDPLLRCDRGIQSLVDLLEKNTTFRLNVDPTDPAFCKSAEIQASQYAEQHLLAVSTSGTTGTGGGAVAPGAVRVESKFAVAFLSRFGHQQVGTIPVGEVITPVARSYTQFSKMILVRGNGFEVFMDYRDTTMTDAQFAALQNVDSVTPNPACNAGWCKTPSG